MVKYKVAKIGWENENPFLDVLLLSKKEREHVQVELHSLANVKRGKKSQIAVVGVQFRELLDRTGICSVNKQLAKALGLRIGSIVEIENDVTESQWGRYQSEHREIEVRSC